MDHYRKRVYAVVVGLLLKTTGMRLKDSFIFAGMGFGAHIFEDVLIFNPGYEFLWPLSAYVFGIGIVEYKPDLYGIANSDAYRGRNYDDIMRDFQDNV